VKKQRSILFYISGHGYGHATRSIEIIEAIGRIRPEIPIYVRSWASPDIFKHMQHSVYYSYCQYDIGVVQSDGITMDIRETIKRMGEILDCADHSVCEELDLVKQVYAGCVVSDIPSIAHRIAHLTEIPNLAVTNFSWDWIYEGWLNDFPDAGSIVRRMRKDYNYCDCLLRLPYSEYLPAFQRVEDMPMLGRKASLSKEIVLKRLGLESENRPLVLLSFGGMGLKSGELPLLKSNSIFCFISTFPVDNKSVIRLPRIEDKRIRYPDLVGAVDVVVTKPGYGIVSECAVNHTRMLYTERGLFREYDAILKCLPYWNCSEFISRDRLLKGQWEKELEHLMSVDPCDVPGAAEAASAEGANVIAHRILKDYDLGRTAN